MTSYETIPPFVRLESSGGVLSTVDATAVDIDDVDIDAVAQWPKTVTGAQSDPNYVSRLLLDCVLVFHKIITPAYLLYRSAGRSLSIYTDTFRNAVDCRFEWALEVQRWTRARSECLPGAQKL